MRCESWTSKPRREFVVNLNPAAGKFAPGNIPGKEITMTTNLVAPGRPGAEELSERDVKLAMKGGSVNLGRVADAIDAKLPKPSAKPAAMTDAERQKRLAELMLQLGSEAAAKSALAMEGVLPK